MIKTTLPIIETSINEEKQTLVSKESTIEVSIDTSLFAEERWERNFPAQAKNETLFVYIERVRDEGKLESKEHIVSNLKAIFCFIESDKIPDFKAFLQMFNIADQKYTERLIERIKFIFNLALSNSTVTSKN